MPLKETLLKQVSPESEKGVKKLVLVLATSTPVTETRKEAVKAAKAVGTTKAVQTAEVGKNGEENKGKYPNLAQVLCIRYPITLRKKSVSMSALLNSGSEINAIHPTLARELELPIRPTNVRAQKIDGTMLDTFGMVVTAFPMTNKANQVKFFKKTFLVANISPEVVLGILFLTLSGTDIDF